jgi:L-alanine-DL-glutamate epimerase-like enolase superfamily enzyme
MATIERTAVSAYTVPTDAPESDGTLEWQSTTIVVVEVEADGCVGLGYTYAHRAAGVVIADLLLPLLQHHDPMNVAAAWVAMTRAVRNQGRPGLASAAIAAVDVALWDLKARLLGLPLVTLLGPLRDAVPIYGSGGFTSYTVAELQQQLAGWVDQGIPRVKMKVGRVPADDVSRVQAARAAIGPAAALFVDANGALTPAQALAAASRFSAHGVSWFEEPVSSDDLDGLRWLRQRYPPGMEVAAGEYGYDAPYFHRMLAGAVDVLQADATRCGGITGFLQAGVLCDAAGVPLSAHTAPALHAHLGCAVARVRHVEWFHDHVRLERMLFAGAPEPHAGLLRPDLSRPGLGLEFKRAAAAPYAVG